MTKINLALFVTLVALFANVASAKTQVNQNPGFVGPEAGGLISVKELLATATDDMRVVLQGNITKRISEDKYVFTDKTGEIVAEIDNKNMPADQQITPETSVKLYGKVDKEFFPQKIEIDAKLVEVQK
jgi:uncharacterized protein (TIGR00156 family)